LTSGAHGMLHTMEDGCGLAAVAGGAKGGSAQRMTHLVNKDGSVQRVTRAAASVRQVAKVARACGVGARRCGVRSCQSDYSMVHVTGCGSDWGLGPATGAGDWGRRLAGHWRE
jgi:hypothetical protein